MNLRPRHSDKTWRFSRTSLFLCLALVLFASATFAADNPPSANVPIPQDVGVAGLKQMLVRLHTTARLMHTTAHPDDEDGGMLVLESRGKGVDALQLTLNRGEGGQNRTGSNLFDVLGVVRTLELLAADRYYGVQQRFTRVADFGFSKSPEETFEKWHGHEIALEDMVRVIRTFRPDVIISRFQGNERDGHGHHQAAGILTREAFRAAADPTRFPEQIKEGLQPWQTKELYIDNVRPPMSTQTPAAEDYTLSLDTGAVDPALGMSYVQFAMQGLKHQLSQGAGNWNVPPGPRISYYKLVDSVLPPLPPGTHETSFFDGIDTSVVGIAARLGEEQNKVPFLRADLMRLTALVDQATSAAQRDPASAAQPLLAGFMLTRTLLNKVTESKLSGPARAEVVAELRTKQEQFAHAANLGLSINLSAVANVGPTVREGFTAVPGEAFNVKATLRIPVDAAGAPIVKVETLQLDVPPGWQVRRMTPIGGHKGVLESTFTVIVPADAPYSRPCVSRADPERDAIYTVANDACAVLPLPPPAVRARSTYYLNGADGEISTPVEVNFVTGDESLLRPLAVGPKFSVEIRPGTLVVPAGRSNSIQVTVAARTNLPHAANARIELRPPAGWVVRPASLPAHFDKPGENREFHFTLVPPPDLREGIEKLQAVLISGGKSYSEGYTVVARPDLGAALYYQPSTARISAVQVNVPAGLKVGYIMGAGDDIPAVLSEIGMNVAIITPQELASGDLNKYGTIVLGIRAYDTRPDVRANNKRLLDFVSNGGTLLVQYNASTGEFNSGHFTPFPATLSRERVTVEEAPVQILAPNDPVFSYPNAITAQDFVGWVQERGLYFMSDWASEFTPLLASNDPGEKPLPGGLLKARYGKGTYIYTGYAFFRQLPAGVPGAIRLFVNLVSAK